MYRQLLIHCLMPGNRPGLTDQAHPLWFFCASPAFAACRPHPTCSPPAHAAVQWRQSAHNAKRHPKTRSYYKRLSDTLTVLCCRAELMKGIGLWDDTSSVSVATLFGSCSNSIPSGINLNQRNSSTTQGNCRTTVKECSNDDDQHIGNK